MAVLERLSIDQLLGFHEELSYIPQHGVDGQVSTVPIIKRSGPYMLGAHDSEIAVHRQRTSKPNIPRSERTVYRKDRLASLLADVAGSVAAVDAFADNPEKALELAVRKADIPPVTNCDFCYPAVISSTPPQIVHPNLYTPAGKPVISFPNIKPIVYEHQVTVFTDHKLNLIDLTDKDIVNYFASLYQLAWNFRSVGAIGMLNFFNFGEEANASEDHFHYHSGHIRTMEDFFAKNERARMLAGYDGDPHGLMPSLMDIIRQERRELFIFENPWIFIHAMWTPKYTHHINVIFKDKSNILDYRSDDPTRIPSDLETAARSMLGIFHALAKKGITDINMALHQATFIGDPYGFMMQAEIYGANGHKHGAYEKSGLGLIVPTHPTETARIVRPHFN